MAENNNDQQLEHHEEDSNASFLVPGRVTLEDLHKQGAELRAAKEVSKGSSKGSERMFRAVSMYSVAMDFALIIAAPLILFILAGRWADKHFGTKYLVIVGILLAITVSAIGIAKQITKLSNFMKEKK